MKRLTIEQIEAIRERAEKATPGPWAIGKNSGNEVITKFNPRRKPITTRPDCDGLNDAKFIANARQDISALLAEVEYLTGVIGTLKICLEIIGEHTDNSSVIVRVQEAIKYAEENL